MMLRTTCVISFYYSNSYTHCRKSSAPSFRGCEETRRFYIQKLLHTEAFTHRDRTREIAIFPQFLMFNVHFVRKGRDGQSKIAIFPQFLTSNVHFVRKGCDGPS